VLAYYPGRFSPLIGEDWLVGSHGGGGITSRMNVPMKCYSDEICAFLETNIEASGELGGQSELGAAASRMAVWWDLRLASLLTHLFFFVL